jgi:hypothetical protein
MVKSSLVANDSLGILTQMVASTTELTVKEEVAQETKKLCASGVPEFLASIQAAVIVSKRRQAQERKRGEALLSHCVEP